MVLKLLKIGFIAAVFFVLFYKLVYKTPVVVHYEEKWWGPGQSRPMDETVRPFVINVSNEILNDLKIRLENTLPFQEPLADVKHHYGLNTNLLEKVVHFWKNEYNWTKRQQFYNQYPHFLTHIQGLDIHFVHIKPKVFGKAKVIPLMLLHGWLGSIREFYDLIPYLLSPQKDRDFAFEIIIPSLPGFAYSDAASKPGLSSFHMSIVMKNLMQRLGFQRFLIHGTDWGGSVVQYMSALFPDKVIALHSSFCIIDTTMSQVKLFLYSLYPSLFVEKEFVDLIFPLSKIWSFRMLEGGYMHIQATKPDTIGVGLRESPAGLAAYMLEKISTLTNPAYKDLDDGGLTEKYSLTTLLDNVMLYWVTGSITTSMRIYAEHFSAESRNMSAANRLPITVPSGCARFKHDVLFYPRSVLEERYRNLIHLTFYEAGHFPALEVPEILSADMLDFFEKALKI